MERLRLIREEKRMSQVKLGIELGDIAQETISGYEVGRSEPNLETLCKIADFFHISVDYLLERTDVKITSSSLKENEEELIYLFRNLPPDKQERAIGVILGLKDC